MHRFEDAVFIRDFIEDYFRQRTVVTRTLHQAVVNAPTALGLLARGLAEPQEADVLAWLKVWSDPGHWMRLHRVGGPVDAALERRWASGAEAMAAHSLSGLGTLGTIGAAEHLQAISEHPEQPQRLRAHARDVLRRVDRKWSSRRPSMAD